ncbi:flagellar basal body-associated protein FliL [Phytobacter ursingii]|uniref:flagellar basal body-associated protein FliL n=1 Tax=Phytobacter ursingii TaxID=1972431 RepID=UPI000CD08174|nr:flagellar basal body-associated protein FliL [Enterobacteriaceae bacterium ENNIH1]RDT55532.1 flagellar basal body-associated protein FliL [Escherichia coli]
MTDTAINKKKRKRKIWIPLLVLITLAACATAGYSYWRMQQHPSTDAKAETEAPPPPPAPVFFALDTFTVNLGDADRVLYIGITLRLKDDATRARLSEYLPEVRSRLLLLFSRQDASKLATDEGKQQLATAIKEAIATPLVAGQPKQEVTDVLYTAFILR